MDTHIVKFPECASNHFGLCVVDIRDKLSETEAVLCDPRLGLVRPQAVLEELVHLDQILDTLGQCSVLHLQRPTKVVPPQ